MLYVKDDNNDDLFRRAAESYPLRTDAPNWDAVQTKMATGTNSVANNAISKKGWRKYLVLLLLLPLIIIVFQNKPGFFNTGSRDRNHITKGSAASSPIHSVNKINSGTLKQIEILNKKEEKAGVPLSKIKKSYSISKIGISDKLTRTSPDTGINAAGHRIGRNNAGRKTHTAIIYAPASGDEGIENEYLSKGNIIDLNTKEAGNNTAQEKYQELKMDNPLLPIDTIKTKEKATAKNKRSKKEKEKKQPGPKRFYIGLLGGADLSVVKLQSVKKTGFSFGIIAGFKMSKKLSIESGLFNARKYYNTAGEYFSTNLISLAPNVTLDHVNGFCNMLEIPLNLNYTISQNQSSSWIASTGISSYFMKNESYVYDLNNNGSQYSKKYSYNNRSTTLAAAVNVSIGYSYRVGKTADIRVQPYLKIPISKTGTGKLPIQSAGINISITKKLF